MMKALAALGFRLAGWTVQPMGDLPKKCVIIGYPHTSNWDFILLQGVAFYFGIKLSWLGKKQLFPFGLATIMRKLGGIPVDRRAPQGLVHQVAEEIRAAPDTLRLVVPPEGTRSRVDYWKSGFYRIALAAEVPIQVAEVCFRRKVIGFGITIHPTGHVREDMDAIRAYLAGKYGLHHELASPIRLKDEETEQAGS